MILNVYSFCNILQHIQHGGGTSALKVYTQKPAIGYEELDFDFAEVVSSLLRAYRLSSTRSVGHTNSFFKAN